MRQIRGAQQLTSTCSHRRNTAPRLHRKASGTTTPLQGSTVHAPRCIVDRSGPSMALRQWHTTPRTRLDSCSMQAKRGSRRIPRRTTNRGQRACEGRACAPMRAWLHWPKRCVWQCGGARDRCLLMGVRHGVDASCPRTRTTMEGLDSEGRPAQCLALRQVACCVARHGPVGLHERAVLGQQNRCRRSRKSTGAWTTRSLLVEHPIGLAGVTVPPRALFVLVPFNAIIVDRDAIIVIFCVGFGL